MEIAFVVEEREDLRIVHDGPWSYHAPELADAGIRIVRFDDLKQAWRRFDAMILLIGLNWTSARRFKPELVMPVMRKYAAYRAAFPETPQIVLNHTDMCRYPYAVPYWRKGDPILFRTPPYDRDELEPFPAEDIFAFERVLTDTCLTPGPIRHPAGFIGLPSGPEGYREKVAAETAKVGIGICCPSQIPKPDYDAQMGSCRIMVCPRGWGEQSKRHWEAWRAGKAVLTDRDCDSVEMIPGLRLRDKVHYLVYDDPAEIPDLVSDWTRPGRAADLEQIAARGKQAAASYDASGRMVDFFRGLSSRGWSAPR